MALTYPVNFAKITIIGGFRANDLNDTVQSNGSGFEMRHPRKVALSQGSTERYKEV